MPSDTPAAVADTPVPLAGERNLLRVWIDQDLCTGDGFCVQEAPNVFEFDIDGLAYVKGPDGELLSAPGASVDVPADTIAEVLDSAKNCPGLCIHVVREDGVVVGGPDRVTAGGTGGDA